MINVFTVSVAPDPAMLEKSENKCEGEAQHISPVTETQDTPGEAGVGAGDSNNTMSEDSHSSDTQYHLETGNIKSSLASPSPPVRSKKLSRKDYNKSQESDKESMKSRNNREECNSSIIDEFDPYEIVENIADLTVEQLKESLLREANNNDDSVPSNNNNHVDISAEVTRPKRKTPLREIKEDEGRHSVTPPSRSKRKEKTGFKTENEISTRVSSSSLSSSNSVSRSDTPTKKRCRLRVVPNKDEIVKPEDKKNGKTEKTEDRVDIEVEHVMHEVKKCEQRNPGTLSDEISGSKIDGTVVRNDENDKSVFKNKKKEKKPVNITIKPVNNFENVKNGQTNGQLCRQTRGWFNIPELFILVLFLTKLL